MTVYHDNVFPSTFIQARDGARVTFDLDLGFGQVVRRELRIHDLDIPYSYEDFDAAAKSVEFITAELGNAAQIMVRSIQETPGSQVKCDISYQTQKGDWKNLWQQFNVRGKTD